MSIAAKYLAMLLTPFVTLAVARAAEQSTAFAYTGFLRQNGSPVTGVRSMSFRLFNAATGGAAVGAQITIPSVQVENGVFVVDLDFPGAFTGDQRWMQTTVAGQVMSPRKIVSTTPVAQYAMSSKPKALDCKTVLSRYPAGTFELQCPANYTAVAASCDLGVSLVIADATRPLPPGSDRWIWYLIPDADHATGVHCELPGTSSSTEASIRCCRS
jgi:hypothetical protein